MRSLVIGGTRNLGPSIVRALLERGDVAVLNRGVTPDDLPRDVERLRADRRDREQLKAVIGRREFDLVVDTSLYNGAEAMAAVELFSGRIGCYIFVSTGQVYLVRVGLERPFREEDYEGPVMPEPPKTNEYDHANWVYGIEKRQAEDAFAEAFAHDVFPFTSLRLPIVNSERDHYDRLYGYFLRLTDGGPVVIPKGEGLPLRHVYGEDVTQAVVQAADCGKAKGRAYNIGQDETLTIREFLQITAELLEVPLRLVELPRETLEREGLLPQCSPFSGRWASALDNARSKQELGMQYTPVREYLKKLIGHFAASPRRNTEGYAQRARELHVAQQVQHASSR